MVITIELKPENYGNVSRVLNKVANAMENGIEHTGFSSMALAKVHRHVPLRCCAWGCVWYTAYNIEEITDFDLLQNTVTEAIGGDADIYAQIAVELLGAEDFEILRRVYVHIVDTPLPGIYRKSDMRLIEWIIQMNDNLETSEEAPDPRVEILRQLRAWVKNPTDLMEIA